MHFIIKAMLLCTEKILSECALLAAIVSFAQTGSIIERLFGSALAIGRTLAGFGIAFYHNTPVSEAMSRFFAGMSDGIGNATKNLQEDPQQVLLALLLTYAVFKAVPWLLSLIRQGGFKRRPPEEGRIGKGPADQNKQTTFHQLY